LIGRVPPRVEIEFVRTTSDDINYAVMGIEMFLVCTLSMGHRRTSEDLSRLLYET
jgi:hypothetical protein